jgi:anti-sigma regulatory factor (Ser/Thr protein kinase)
MTHPIAIAVSESSQVGEARRKAATLARELGFSDTAQGKVEIVVTELANNLVHHTPGGELLLHPIEQQGSVGLEVLSLDKGPGMANIEACLQDGFSTAGTAGNGLGAIARLSSLLQIYSWPQNGAALLCQMWPALPPEPQRLEIGAICLPKAGERVSGDAWTSRTIGDRHLLMVADGLGHGEMAAAAAAVAIRSLRDHPQRSPTEILQAAHAASRSTRGSAVAIAEINLDQGTVEYTGVGNIAGVLVSAEKRSSLVSHHGTIGHEVRKIQSFRYAWDPSGLLILTSDGLGSQWRLDGYPGLQHRHPSLIAGVLYRDFRRDRDDVTVVVVREGN